MRYGLSAASVLAFRPLLAQLLGDDAGKSSPTNRANRARVGDSHSQVDRYSYVNLECKGEYGSVVPEVKEQRVCRLPEHNQRHTA